MIFNSYNFLLHNTKSINSQARRIDRGDFRRTDYISVKRADPSKTRIEDLNILIVFLKYYNSSIP